MHYFAKNPIQQNKSNRVSGTNKAGQQGRQAGWVDVPTLTANILWQPLTELTFTRRQAVHAINQSIQWDVCYNQRFSYKTCDIFGNFQWHFYHLQSPVLMHLNNIKMFLFLLFRFQLKFFLKCNQVSNVKKTFFSSSQTLDKISWSVCPRQVFYGKVREH